MNRRFIHRFWLSKIEKGDTESFAKLYDDLADKIFRFALFKVNNAEEAEDVTSQTFLNVWHSLQSGTKVYSIRAFVYRTTRNLIIDYYRAKTESVSIDQTGENTLQEFLIEVTNLEEQTIKKSDLAIIYTALRSLKEDYREIIILKYIDDLPTKDICHILNKNPNAVRAQVLRAMTALKDSLPQDIQLHE